MLENGVKRLESLKAENNKAESEAVLSSEEDEENGTFQHPSSVLVGEEPGVEGIGASGDVLEPTQEKGPSRLPLGDVTDTVPNDALEQTKSELAGTADLHPEVDSFLKTVEKNKGNANSIVESLGIDVSCIHVKVLSLSLSLYIYIYIYI